MSLDRKPSAPQTGVPGRSGLGISAVVTLTGVGEHTLRAWERRYGLPRPRRTAGGFRRYSAAEVRLVERMRDAVGAGVPAAAAARQVLSAPIEAGPPRAAGLLAEELLAAVLAGDAAAVGDAVAAARTALPPPLLVRAVVEPVLHRLGALWEQGAIGVDVEHIGTNLVVRALAPAAAAGPRRGPRVLIGCAPGERHDVCLLALGIRCHAAGWRVTSLGQDVPAGAFLAAAQRLRPAAVAVSVTWTARCASALEAVAEISAGLPGTPVFLGGQGLGGTPPPPGSGDEDAFWRLVARPRGGSRS